MSYFDDVKFVGGGEYADCRHGVIDKQFDQFYSIQFDLSGRILYGVDHGVVVEVEAPVMYLLHPEHHYTYGPTADSGIWHHGWVAFQGERAKRLFEEGFQEVAPAGFLVLSRPLGFAERFREMLSAMQNPARHGRAVHALEGLLLLAEEEARNRIGESADLPSYQAVLKRMEADPFCEWNFEAEASAMSLSYSRFRKRFCELLGSAPYDMLLQCRMRRVAECLGEGGCTVKDVAGRFGYTDLAALSKQFKKQIGLAPRRYLDVMRLHAGER